MADNNAHEKAFCDALIQLLSDNGISNARGLFEKTEDAEKVGVFVGIPYSEPQNMSTAVGMDFSGYWKSTLLISCRVNSMDDDDTSALYALVKSVRDIIHTEDITAVLNDLLPDQTVIAFLMGNAVPGKVGNIRTSDLSYSIVHHINKD